MDDEKFNGSVKKYLDNAIERKASDLHLTIGVVPTLRVDGILVPIPNEEVLSLEIGD